MKPVTLTIDLLKSKGACQTALTDLEMDYGRMVTFREPPTLARALQASGGVSWFAANMLTNTIRAEYIRQRATIWAEYERQCAPIRAKYRRQHNTIRAECDRQCATIVATLYFEQVSGDEINHQKETIMKPVTLTIDLLKSKGACQTALTDLETTHGRMVTFREPSTLARALQASGEVLWFAENMLTGTILAEYDRQLTPIRAEYEHQRAKIWAEYERQLTPIWPEYERQRAPILAEYERQRAPIRAEYERQHAQILVRYPRQRATIRDEYNRQHAPIWAEYIRQHAPIWSEYERQHAPIRAEYEHQRAPILAECVRQDNTIWAECARQRATIVATLYFEQVSGMNRRPS